MVTTVTDNSPQAINTSLFSLDKEVQEIKKVTDKLAGINTESGVISVNGKRGIVELTASDVDALPSSTVIPTTTSELENTSGFITASSDITGNAATATTAYKVANALTVNGKTYDGSSAVDAGVQTVANGGTGATDAAGGFNTLADGVRDSTTPADNEKMLLKPSGTWYKTTCLDFWNYIKGKISSVLGLTKDNYGGTANKVASAGISGMWIQGRSNAICKTTSAGASGGWKPLASIKTSSGSIEIGNLSGEDYIRIVYISDTDVNAGNNKVSHVMQLTKQSVEFPTAKASGKLVIPIGAPSSLEDGCIWIER